MVLASISIKLFNSVLPAFKLSLKFSRLSEGSFLSFKSSNIFPNLTSSTPLVKSPPINKSFTSLKNFNFWPLALLSLASNAVGKIPSITLVMFLTIWLALLWSLTFNPCFFISLSNISCVNLPLGVKGALIYLSIALWNWLLLYAKSFPLLAKSFAVLPAPKAKGVTSKDSLPNLILFINFLAASSLPTLSPLSNSVGPSNMSPKVPISSLSTTKVSPAAPPVMAAAYLGYLALLFKLRTFVKASDSLSLSGVEPFFLIIVPGLTPNLFATSPNTLRSLPKLAYALALLAFKALAVNFLAALFATLNPTPPGTAIWTMASVNFPINLSSATSSKGFNLSKNSSTSAALSVSIPRSINSAPNETIPSGILIIPDARPAAKDLYQLVELSSSAIIKSYFYILLRISRNLIFVAGSFLY